MKVNKPLNNEPLPIKSFVPRYAFVSGTTFLLQVAQEGRFEDATRATVELSYKDGIGQGTLQKNVTTQEGSMYAYIISSYDPNHPDGLQQPIVEVLYRGRIFFTAQDPQQYKQTTAAYEFASQ